MDKVYEFKVAIKDGQVAVQHNCENLIEFVGVLEIVKALGLKMFDAKKNDAKVDPNEYLKQIQQNQVQVSTKVVNLQKEI